MQVLRGTFRVVFQNRILLDLRQHIHKLRTPLIMLLQHGIGLSRRMGQHFSAAPGEQQPDQDGGADKQSHLHFIEKRNDQRSCHHCQRSKGGRNKISHCAENIQHIGIHDIPQHPRLHPLDLIIRSFCHGTLQRQRHTLNIPASEPVQRNRPADRYQDSDQKIHRKAHNSCKNHLVSVFIRHFLQILPQPPRNQRVHQRQQQCQQHGDCELLRKPARRIAEPVPDQFHSNPSSHTFLPQQCGWFSYCNTSSVFLSNRCLFSLSVL